MTSAFYPALEKLKSIEVEVMSQIWLQDLARDPIKYTRKRPSMCERDLFGEQLT